MPDFTGFTLYLLDIFFYSYKYYWALLWDAVICESMILSDPAFSLFSRGAQLLVHPWPKTGLPLTGMVVLFDRARSFGRDAHGAVREEGDTRLASQISRINPGDQRGDRCRNQIALTSLGFLKQQQNWFSLWLIFSHSGGKTFLGTLPDGLWIMRFFFILGERNWN